MLLNLIFDFDKTPMTMPPTTPAIIPDIGGALLATAIPKQSGSATRKTTKLADKSDFNKSANPFFIFLV